MDLELIVYLILFGMLFAIVGYGMLAPGWDRQEARAASAAHAENFLMAWREKVEEIPELQSETAEHSDTQQDDDRMVQNTVFAETLTDERLNLVQARTFHVSDIVGQMQVTAGKAAIRQRPFKTFKTAGVYDDDFVVIVPEGTVILRKGEAVTLPHRFKAFE